VGSRLDAKPELLFRLRAVDENDLVATIGDVLPMSKQGPAAGKVLEADDMAALFGLDMGDVEEPAAPPPPDKIIPVAARKKAPSRLKAVAAKPVPTKPTVQVASQKAEPKPVERRKPALSKQVGKARVATCEAVRPSTGRKLRSAS
jgi:hypothetical protein